VASDNHRHAATTRREPSADRLDLCRLSDRGTTRTTIAAEWTAGDPRVHAQLRSGGHVHAVGRRLAVDGRYVESKRPRSGAAIGERAQGLHRRRTLHVLSRRRAGQLQPDRGHLPTPTDDSRSQPVAASRRTTGDGGAPNSARPRHREQRTATAGEGHRPLALVPRTRSGRHRRATTPAGRLESRHRHERLMAYDDSWAGTLQPGRLGRHALRDQRHQQPPGRHVQTRPLRRRRCFGRSNGASLDAVRARQAHGTDPLGADGGAGTTT
jgi:hypothetical protein